jgi:stage V sporulation protein AD
MATKRIGKQTVKLQKPPSIIATASIVGPKEGEGPLRLFFDEIIEDELFGEKTWEKAESRLMRETFAKVLKKADKAVDDIDYIFAGDLLNQCTAANFGLRESGVPFFGVFGACSTMAESMSLGSLLVDGDFADIPFPSSSTVISTPSVYKIHSILTSPLEFSYPCIIALVTASDTAVFTSANSSIVGSICDTKAAATTLAKPSLLDLLENSNFI